MTIAAFDQYLASAVASILRAEPVPVWPAGLSGDTKQAAQRIAFHGIALLLAQAPAALDHWPPALARAVREQAGIQSFWERSHRAAITPLLEALAAAGIDAVVTKGTALAYSLYHDPALRRRGDTDILIRNASRKKVRKVLRACGFWETSDKRALQESWQSDTEIGFAPAVDVHWCINASAAVSRMLETGLRFDQTTTLERLSPRARGVGTVDNLILTAINRSSHGKFGYNVGNKRLFDSDRLIWAVDAHLLALSFTPNDWQTLADRTARTGTAAMVSASLGFAQTALGTSVPAEIAASLAHAPQDRGLAVYHGASSHLWRLRRDVAACRNLDERARVLRYVAFPSDEFLRARFPDAAGWPKLALYLRRWLEGAGKLMIRRS
jgi:hypothetical protein